MLAKTLFSLLVIATSALMVRAEEAKEENAIVEAGCKPIKEKECLGLCECPKGWNTYISLLNQVQCQEVLPHGCPQRIVVPIGGPSKAFNQGTFPDIDALEIVFNQVCISDHIFVRPHCQYPICLESIVSAFTSNPSATFAAILAVIEQSADTLNLDPTSELLERIEAAILSVRGIVFDDGALGVAGYLTTADCNHECKPGFSAALEILVRAFDRK